MRFRLAPHLTRADGSKNVFRPACASTARADGLRDGCRVLMAGLTDEGISPACFGRVSSLTMLWTRHAD